MGSPQPPAMVSSGDFPEVLEARANASRTGLRQMVTSQVKNSAATGNRCLTNGMLVIVSKCFVERACWMSRTPAQFVQGQIARNGKQPCGKLRGHLVAVRGFVDLHKDVLGNVLRFGQVTDSARDEVDDR